MARSSRHKASIIAESLLDGRCKHVTRRAIELALGGDIQALKMCLERILPPVRERPCTFKLPPISTAAEAAACMAQVLEGLASGEILPGEGAALGAAISGYVKILGTTEIEARISALEARGHGSPSGDGLLNRKAPGAPGILDERQRQALRQVVEDGPIPAIHGIVRSGQQHRVHQVPQGLT
jgi:hypothetical protein